MINHTARRIAFMFVIALVLLNVHVAAAQTTAFTYQGKLTDGGSPASGSYDLTFRLFDTATVDSGTQQGATVSINNVSVAGGVFTVQLDFGACAGCFNGPNRFLEIAVKPSGGSSLTTLSPRQAITSTPYAIKSANAAIADGLSLSCLNCVTSAQIQSVQGSQVIGNIAGNQINGTIPVASVPAGSTSYIHNGTAPQAASNFNLSGDGTAGGTLSGNIVNATTQFNLGGNRILSTSGTNLFIGVNSASVAGDRNGSTFVGSSTGKLFGNDNTIVGSNAGILIVGGQPIYSKDVTLIGASANADPFGINLDGNATAIGAHAFVSQRDSLVLGGIAGINGATQDTKVGIGTTTPAARLHVQGNTILNGNATLNGDVAIGTATPQFKLHVIDSSNTGLRVQTNASGGTVASFGGLGDFQIDGPGMPGGRLNAKENGTVIIGDCAGCFPNVPDRLVVNGTIRTSLASAGALSVCRNSNNQLSTCSSSIRYKTKIADFASGLSLINRLRPVTFDWKESKARDLGLVAEEVAAVEPLLVVHNDKGEIEGVKYDHLSAVFINAFKEQQAQIKSQAEALKNLQTRLASLERVIWRTRHRRQPRRLTNRK
jgi:hypothetical protein